MTAVLNPRVSVLVLVLLGLAVLLAVLGPAMAEVSAPVVSHANERHGTEADTARQCLNGRGGHLFWNSTTNRYGVVCDLDGLFGIVILDEAGREVTAFLKNKMKRFDQVLKYMRNQGYELVQ